jgi:hypothetical protein
MKAIYTFVIVWVLLSNLAYAQKKPVDTDEDGFYNISTLDELRWISENEEAWSLNYELDNDIYCQPTRIWNDSSGWMPIAKFSGVFEGYGFSLIGLYINRPQTNNIGFINHIYQNGIIRNLNIIDADVCGCSYTGTIAAKNMGIIQNCSVVGKIKGKDYVGGVSGLNQGTISGCDIDAAINGQKWIGGVTGENKGNCIECNVRADIKGRDYVGGVGGKSTHFISNSSSKSLIKGGEYVGGLVGYNEGDILNSSSDSEIKAVVCAGGLLGYHKSNLILNCYSHGAIFGFGTTGGLIGDMNGGSLACSYSTTKILYRYGTEIGGLIGHAVNSNILKSYWDIDASGTIYTDGGEGKRTMEMKSNVLYAGSGWNFDFVWKAENDYPYLYIDKDLKPYDNDDNDTIDIKSINQLRWLGESGYLIYGDYELDSSIDASGTLDWNGGLGFVPLNRFDNVIKSINGNGFSIENLDLSSKFAYSLIDNNEGVIQNLHLKNFNADCGAPVSGFCRNNSGEIVNCSFEGGIRGIDQISGIAYKNSGLIDMVEVVCDFQGSEDIAGIAINNRGIIQNSIVKGKIEGTSKIGGCAAHQSSQNACILFSKCEADIEGTMILGGITASNVGTIFACHSECEVSGKSEIGGIVGTNIYKISNLNRPGIVLSSFSNSVINGDTLFGAVVGNGMPSYGCFWNSSRSDYDMSAMPLTDAELKQKEVLISTGVNLDFIWNITESYPFIDYKENYSFVDDDKNGYYDIKTPVDLRYLSESPKIKQSKFELKNSIDMGETELWNCGAGFYPIGKVCGNSIHNFNLNGNYQKITDLKIRLDSMDHIAFVSHRNEDSLIIEKLSIEDCHITGHSQVAVFYSHLNDMLFERKRSYQILRECSSSGTVIGISWVGGLTTYECPPLGNVANCYSKCDLYGQKFVGGLIGNHFGLVENSYFAGRINQPQKNLGAIIGSNRNIVFLPEGGWVQGGTVEKCFWDYNLNLESNRADTLGQGMSSTEMQTKSTYTNSGWDFENIWDINPDINDGYPFFKNAFVSVEDEFEMVDELLIYPNPAQNYININTEPYSQFKIYNSIGELVLEDSGNRASIGDLKCGVYYISVETGRYTFRGKFIKQ